MLLPYLFHGKLVLLLPLVVLIEHCSVLVVLRRHDLEEGRLSLGEPRRPRAAERDHLVAVRRVVVGCALAPRMWSRGLASGGHAEAGGWAGGSLGDEGDEGTRQPGSEPVSASSATARVHDS